MSEGDSLSDSDWLDIASNRESDDNDSVMSGDSDGEDMGMVPLSRRSSISIGSSRDGDVDAWEGFVDESGDEAQCAEPAIAMPPGPTTAVMDVSSLAASEVTVGETHDHYEEQRVIEALDQSMISTLSASRSSTGSAHASLRDLRLSFPDPLTSSRDDLDRSYEDVPSSDATFDTETPTDDASDIDNVPACTNIVHCEDDPGSFTPAVTKQALEDDRVMFEVVLYGSPSPIKWSFVASLIEKAALVSGHKLVEPVPGANEIVRYLRLLTNASNASSTVTHLIPVHDRTETVKAVIPSYQTLVKRPSLAIVYLPSTLHTLAATEHTLYLPVLVPSLSGSELFRSSAMRDWDTLSIPSDKVANLNFDTTSPIFNGADAKDIRDMRAHHLLQRLLSVAKKRPNRAFSDHISPVQAVTLSTSPTPTTTTLSPATTFWGIFSPEVNHTSVIATTARANTPIMTPHQEISLSIVNPGTTSLSISSVGKQQTQSSSMTPQAAGSHCQPPSWTDKVKSAKDTIVKPVTQVAAEAGPSTTAIAQSEGSVGTGSKTTALSLVASMSEALDIHVTRIRKDYRVDEVIESLDELARAIRRQTIHRVDKGKGKAKEIRDSVQYRHERARGKAKELKKKGEEIIYLASGEFVERTTIAKKKARDITLSLAKSESWRTYQKVHAEWMEILKEKGREGSTGIRKGKGKCNRVKSGGPCSLFSRSFKAGFYLA
ncbi:hypothetical protein DXG01_005247 [Tephrocybe rancida]|nr:hypothetical protein DXG01_005247 [Tephrocybe rancida]